MKTLKKLLAALWLLTFVFALPSPAELSEELASKWSDLTKLLDQGTTLRGKMARLPEKSLLGADQQKTEKKIDKTLRKAQEILLSDDSMELVDRAEVIRKRLPELYAEIEELKNERIGAPEKSYNPLTKTIEDCDEKIAEAEGDIKRLNAELADIRQKISDELRSWGLELTDEQADVLFSSVLGDSLLQNAIIFENVKAVTQQLMELMQQSKSDTTLARKYYGMYITLIDVLLDTEERFIQKIDEDWQPQVQKISDGASASLEEARTALKRSDFTSEQKNIFRSNIASNELTVKAASQYLQLLSQQKESVQKCINDLDLDREVAVNTYATVQHLSDMSSVVHSGLQLFDMLTSMQLPDLKAFDSTELRQEFDEITRRLQQE